MQPPLSHPSMQAPTRWWREDRSTSTWISEAAERGRVKRGRPPTSLQPWEMEAEDDLPGSGGRGPPLGGGGG
jgi:hypothetical protein